MCLPPDQELQTFNVEITHPFGSVNRDLAMTPCIALLLAWLEATPPAILGDTFPWSSHQHPTLTHKRKFNETWPSTLQDHRKCFTFKPGLFINQFK